MAFLNINASETEKEATELLSSKLNALSTFLAKGESNWTIAIAYKLDGDIVSDINEIYAWLQTRMQFRLLYSFERFYGLKKILLDHITENQRPKKLETLFEDVKIRNDRALVKLRSCENNLNDLRENYPKIFNDYKQESTLKLFSENAYHKALSLNKIDTLLISPEAIYQWVMAGRQ